MLRVSNLSKKFGQHQAVHDLTFNIEKGKVLGFIGPNGAGKTTTMRMLTGFIPPTTGSIQINELDIATQMMAVRKIVGYLPETPPLYRELSIGAYLSFVAAIREVPQSKKRIAEVMEEVGLAGLEKRIIGSLSKGYRQRVGLAQAIIHKPSVLILDEPTSGLDPSQMVNIRAFIKELSSERTVILSTHILSQIEALCDQILILKRGQVAAQGTPEDIRQAAGGDRVRLSLSGDSQQYIKILSQHPLVNRLKLHHQTETTCSFDIFFKGVIDPQEIYRLCVEQKWSMHSVHLYQPSLEEAFLNIVGIET